ncbi:RNA polymerase II-associated protein 3 [Drosophila kikkawai]|uniref:RNA polymerase II-associated protein 3 n=1 Tax=Drosophila kikkawai TaxID=30033 RepID=A0A6P4I2Q7_DROKI|nr:RNA polymerase II-associated protein 3 [Drosophila kikkawai]
MSGAKKAFELQRQVRQNAREYESSVKDLYSWEQDIKKKEEELKKSPATVIAKNLPVRSHVQDTQAQAGKGSPGSSAASTPTEKRDLPVDPVAQLHKKANDIKDSGNSYVKLAEYDRAIEAYSEAIKVYPYDPVYYINRALCYIRQERYDNCVEDCEAAIELDKLCVKAYYRRMQANESLGNNMEALKDCTTVLAIEPKNIEAKKSLARINDRLRKNATKGGPNFTADRPDLIDILPLDKPVYKRSKQPMHRVPIVDIISPRVASEETKNLRISDEDIDKIFNSNCGVFEQVKKSETKPNASTGTSAVENIKETKKDTNIKAPKATQQTNSNAPKADQHVEVAKDEKKEIKSAPKATPAVVETPKAQSTTASPPKPARTPSAVVEAKTVKENVQKTEKIEPDSTKIKDSASPLERSLPPPPSGTAQFHVTWKELTASQKYQYLKSIEIANLCKILGAGFDSATFTELLRTVHDFYVPNKEPTTAAVLLEISKNDEFTILAMLMSAEEKKVATSILSDIKNWPNQNSAVLDKLLKAYL